MENVQTKTPEKRRGKYLVVGLLAVILVLSFQLYKQHITKKELIKRKAFLLGKLRESRAFEGKSATKLQEKSRKLEEQQKELALKTKELEQSKEKINELTNSNNQQVGQLQELKVSAARNKESVVQLQQQYKNATSTVETLKGELEKTINTCADTKSKIDGLNTALSAKESALEKCMHDKDAIEREKEGMSEKAKRQTALSQSTQSEGSQSQDNSSEGDTFNKLKSRRRTNYRRGSFVRKTYPATEPTSPSSVSSTREMQDEDTAGDVATTGPTTQRESSTSQSRPSSKSDQQERSREEENDSEKEPIDQ